MSNNSNRRAIVAEWLQRGLQTAVVLGAAAILALVLYTSFAVQGSRNARQAEATATVQARGTAVHATAVAQGTAQAEQVAAWPLHPVSPPTVTISVENAGHVWELARWGQTGPCALAWSPDGRHLAVQDSAGVHFYDALWREQLYLESPSSWCGLAFSPDSQMLAVVSTEAVRLWRWADGKLQRTLDELPGPIAAVAFAPDGTLLVVGRVTDRPIAWLWRDSTGALLFMPEEEAPDVRKLAPLALSPDGQLLAAGSPDGILRLWYTADGVPLPVPADASPLSLAGGRPRLVWRGDTGPIQQLFFSPDSRLLASLSNGEARLWQATDATLRQALAIQPLGATFSPDSARLLVATMDGTVQSWQVDYGVLLGTSPQIGYLWELALSPDGQFLASVVPRGGLASAAPSGGLAVWQTGDWELIAEEKWDVNLWSGLDVSPDGQYVATSTGRQSVWLWRVAIGAPVQILRVPADQSPPVPALLAVAFSPDGALLAGGWINNTVLLWQVPAGTPAGLLVGPAGGASWIEDIAFSPDGRLLAAGSSDGTALLWRTADGSLVKALDEYVDDAVRQVVFSPDGQFLVTLTEMGDVRLWQATDGAFRRTLEERMFAEGVFVSPDSAIATSVSSDGTVRRRLLADGRLLEERRGTGNLEMAGSIATSPDGTLLAVGCWDGSIWLWDTAGGQVAKILGGHSDFVSGLAFSRDGKMLVSAAMDGTVRLWGVRSVER